MSATDGPAFRVISALPGRVRVQLIRHRAESSRHHQERLQVTAERFSSIAGVQESSLQTGARSILVRYDPARQELAAVLTEMTKVLEERLPGSAGPSSSLPVSNHAERWSPQANMRVIHSLPGRLRLHIAALSARSALAAQLDTALKGFRGVQTVEVQQRQGFLIVGYDASTSDAPTILKLVEQLLVQPTTSSPAGEVTHAQSAPPTNTQGLRSLLIPTAAIVLAVTGGWPALVMRGVIIVAALPLARRAVRGASELRLNVDQLDLTALIVLTWRGDYLIVGIMTWLMALGDVIRSKTMARARREVSHLISVAHQQAWIERDGAVVSIPVHLLRPGDTVVVYPGDQIPVDGVITQGDALVDEKMLSGEARPLHKSTGDLVFALTMMVDGQISVQVQHIGKETRAGRIVELIENAPLSDTRIQNYAAKIGDRLVGPIFALALVTYLLGADSLRVAGVLILDFASGIRVSAPTTILSAMTGAAKQGLFIKGGKALETLVKVDAVVFDKTGTLTRGEPVVQAVHALDAEWTADEVLRLTACAEANLKHPAAHAIVKEALTRGLVITPPTQMDYSMGLGVRSIVGEHTLQVGSERYMQHCGIDISHAAILTAENHMSANSLVFIAVGERLVGLLSYTDPRREESAEVIQALLERGVKRIVMLTGDNQRSAHAIARGTGITDVIAEASPEQKAEVIQALRDEGYTVAFVGDGINDAPAFTRANVAISLPQGADVAREVSDVILLDGDLRGLPLALDLSREAMQVLKQNVNIVVWPTALGIAMAVMGRTTPLMSTVISHGTTIVAGLNGLRPLFPKSQPVLPSASPPGDVPSRAGRTTRSM